MTRPRTGFPRLPAPHHPRSQGLAGETSQSGLVDLLLERRVGDPEQLRRAASDQREKLKTQLTDLVNKHFDVRQQRRELQLKRMEDELARLRDAIKQRNEVRESLVKERLLELTGDPRDLGF